MSSEYISFLHDVNLLISYRPWTAGRPSKAALLSVLAMSHRFMMDAGVSWAIQAFDCLDSEDALTPAHRLQLSFRYDLKQWILPAISAIMDQQVARRQLRLISSDDVEQMGVKTYILIVKGVEAIQAARVSVAINPPSAHHCPDCQEEYNCSRTWQEFWVSTVPLVVLAPDIRKPPLQSLVTFLRKANIKNYRDACKSLTLSHFEQTEVLKVESTVKDRVASAIWDLYSQGLR
jgi:hypothetical protein